MNDRRWIDAESEAASMRRGNKGGCARYLKQQLMKEGSYEL
jgi:hypothetical protein